MNIQMPDESHQQFIQKISEIFNRFGIKSVTMDDLAKELGISKKTLYKHFRDKSDVVKKVVDFQIFQQKKEIEQLTEFENQNAIDQFFHISMVISRHLNTINPSTIYDLKKHYPGIWNYILEFKRKTVYENIHANIKKGIMEGLFREDINLLVIPGMFVNCLEWYTIGEHDLHKFSFEEIFSTHFDYHIRGISNTEGNKYLDSIKQDIRQQTREYQTDVNS